jgi:hypothetical protein
VLLHPEGRVAFTNDVVHDLMPGLARMAVNTAHTLRDAGNGRRVFVQPVVWKLVFQGDVTDALHGEIAAIERALALPTNATQPVDVRFAELQRNLLLRSEARFDLHRGHLLHTEVFDRQRALFDALYEDLATRYGEPEGTAYLRATRLQRAVRRGGQVDPHTRRADLDKADALYHLLGFSRPVYGTPVLTQEQIAESLLRIRQHRLRETVWDRIRGVMPRPIAPRTAHVRAVPPIRVTADDDPGAVTREVQRRMQATLDALVAEVAPETTRNAIRNPFVRRGPRQRARLRAAAAG